MAKLRTDLISDLDRESERILIELKAKYDAGKSAGHAPGRGRIHTGALARAVGLKHTGSAKYRLEEKLVPAGLVNRVGKRYDGGGAPVDWELTAQGREWVEENRESLEIPQTPEEAVDVARDVRSVADQARSAAGSANESVRRLREEFGELEDDVEATWSAARDARDRARKAANRAESVADNLRDELGEEMEQRAMDATEDEFAAATEVLNQHEEKIGETVDAHHELFEQVQDIQERYISGLDRTQYELLRTCQAQSQQINDLRQENRKLENEVEWLESKIAALRKEVDEMQSGFLF